MLSSGCAASLGVSSWYQYPWRSSTVPEQRKFQSWAFWKLFALKRISLHLQTSVLSMLFKGGTVPPYNAVHPCIGLKTPSVPPFINCDWMVKPSLAGDYNSNYSVYCTMHPPIQKFWREHCFRQLGGHFTRNSSYGVLELDSFSGVAVNYSGGVRGQGRNTLQDCST